MSPARHAFTAMTFNIRYDEPEDGIHRWSRRRGQVVETIRAHDPDLLAVQEPTEGQASYLAARLRTMLPFAGGFVSRARFDVLADGIFDLSARGPRTCAWVTLHDRGANRPLIFASAHFDTDEAAWLPSTRALSSGLDRVARGLPIVLAGDFNCAAGCEAHRALLSDGGWRDVWYEAGRVDNRTLTYHGFTGVPRLPTGANLDRFLEETSPADSEFAHYQPHVRAHRNYRIDWILVRGALACTSALIDSPRGVLPSDHYPVVAALAWQ